ncbi:MAG: hypothetical protein ACYC4N_31625, partial [Pirellulaceae bacterium]
LSHGLVRRELQRRVATPDGVGVANRADQGVWFVGQMGSGGLGRPVKTARVATRRCHLYRSTTVG